MRCSVQFNSSECGKCVTIALHAQVVGAPNSGAVPGAAAARDGDYRAEGDGDKHARGGRGAVRGRA